MDAQELAPFWELHGGDGRRRRACTAAGSTATKPTVWNLTQLGVRCSGAGAVPGLRGGDGRRRCAAARQLGPHVARRQRVARRPAAAAGRAPGG
jgi:hypothetical protein